MGNVTGRGLALWHPWLGAVHVSLALIDLSTPSALASYPVPACCSDVHYGGLLIIWVGLWRAFSLRSGESAKHQHLPGLARVRS